MLQLTDEEIALIRIALTEVMQDRHNRLYGLGRYAGKQDRSVNTRMEYEALSNLQNNKINIYNKWKFTDAEISVLIGVMEARKHKLHDKIYPFGLIPHTPTAEDHMRYNDTQRIINKLECGDI